jgi:hypothetical protein
MEDVDLEDYFTGGCRKKNILREGNISMKEVMQDTRIQIN